MRYFPQYLRKYLSTTVLNGVGAVLMMCRMLVYAKVLALTAFGNLSIGFLISASLGMVSAFGLFLLMQRELPKLFAGGRETQGIKLICSVCFAVALSAAPLLFLSLTGVQVAGGSGGLLALATVHGATNQIFSTVTTESKSRLLHLEFAVTVLSRAIAVLCVGSIVALRYESAIAVLIAEIITTSIVIFLVFYRIVHRHGRSIKPLMIIAVTRFRKLDWVSAGSLFCSAVLAFLIHNSDRWFAAALLNKAEFAEFAFVWILISMAATFQTTINANLFPNLAALIYQRDEKIVLLQTEKVCFGMLGMLTLLSVPAFFIIKWTVAHYFIQYRAVLLYVPIFLGAAVFRASDFWSNYFVITKRMRSLVVCQVTALVVALLMLVALNSCLHFWISSLGRMSLLTLILCSLPFFMGFGVARIK